MELIKKTSTHKIYKRRDGRYAVTTLKNSTVNGDDKKAILLAEALIKVTAAKPAEEASIEEPAEENAAE